MRFEMVAIPREEFDAMKARLPRATSEGLFDTYRISQNTWYKLRDGLPVKRKTIEQLRARYAQVAKA
ncbi:MAG: hypothetical protein EOP58_08275 [Sphingomonadales bacterium]|nr:MAG: hypothetical protein EOP58_08275 [Sphingomonadales bacterium]